MSAKSALTFNRKKATPIVDSRFIKIVAAKQKDLQDALIFVCLNEAKYGHLDKGQLRKIVEMLERVAPDSVWFGATKDYSLDIIDRAELKNKYLLVTLTYEDLDVVDQSFVEDKIKQAIPEAKSVSFIHTEAHVDVSVK